MTIKEAYKKLDLSEGTDIKIVQSKYNDMYNDFRMMIDNAPTPKLKESFERNLKELEEAFKLINGSKPMGFAQDLPSISKTQNISNSPESSFSVTNIAEVYAYFGVTKDTDSKIIQKKYLSIIKNLEQEIKKQLLPQVRQIYEVELVKTQNYWKILLKEKPDLHTKLVASTSLDWEKHKMYVYVAGGVLTLGIIIVLLLNSGAFEGSEKKELDEKFHKAIDLFSKNNIKNILASEKLFIELNEVEEMKTKVEPWFDKIKESKNEISNSNKKRLSELTAAGKFLEAQIVYNNLSKLNPITDPDLVLQGKEIEKKALAQKNKIKSLTKKGDDAVEDYYFEAALLIYNEAKKENPSNADINGKIALTTEKIKDYEKCNAKLQRAKNIIAMSYPSEKMHQLALKDIEQIKQDCPGLFKDSK